METNKLLTLEDIEKIGSERYPARHGISGDDLEALLATARAYWELKEPAEAPVETVSYRGLGSDEYDQNQRALKEAFEKGRAMAEQEMKDKPHAPTIRAFIDGLKWANDPKKRFTVNELVNYLESILQDLNN